MNENTTAAATKQFENMCIEQANAFAEGLGEVTSEAIKQGMHPAAIAIACASNVAKLYMVLAASNNLSKEEWKKLALELMSSTIEDMSEAFDQFVAPAQKEAA